MNTKSKFEIIYKNRNVIFAIVVLGVILSLSAPKISDIARVPVGYVTKVTCSEVFLANRNPVDVAATNFEQVSPIVELVKVKIDNERKAVAGSLWGFGKATAYFTPQIGCRLDPGTGLNFVSSIPPSKNFVVASPFNIEIDAKVQKATLKLFDDTASEHPIVTRGVVVIRNGDIIAEHYSNGFNKETRQQSWSMAKGVLQSLVGIAVSQKILSLEENNLLPQWPSHDQRSNISIEHLLSMTSGLEFSENYANPLSDVVQMLFNTKDMGAYAASKRLEHKPGLHFKYSSGTTNIISLVLRHRLEAAGRNYHAFPYSELFGPIGMSSAVFEMDPSGTFIGASYIYATPRDFARFGQLYLQDGLWDEKRILPLGWVDYTRVPVATSDGTYGSHWSLNFGQSNLPGMPDDVFYLGGNDGQFIFVIPSKNTVIVRTGVMREPATFEKDLYPLIRNIYRKL